MEQSDLGKNSTETPFSGISRLCHTDNWSSIVQLTWSPRSLILPLILVCLWKQDEHKRERFVEISAQFHGLTFFFMRVVDRLANDTSKSSQEQRISESSPFNTIIFLHRQMFLQKDHHFPRNRSIWWLLRASWRREVWRYVSQRSQNLRGNKLKRFALLYHD